jgi:hypothetical protein
VEVLGIEEFGLTVLDPLGARQTLALCAMPVSTGVIAGAFVGALIAVFPVSAESGSPAQFDRTHDTSLRSGQGSSMLFPIGFAVATQHVRDFQLGTIHEPALSAES